MLLAFSNRKANSGLSNTFSPHKELDGSSDPLWWWLGSSAVTSRVGIFSVFLLFPPNVLAFCLLVSSVLGI